MAARGADDATSADGADGAEEADGADAADAECTAEGGIRTTGSRRRDDAGASATSGTVVEAVGVSDTRFRRRDNDNAGASATSGTAVVVEAVERWASALRSASASSLGCSKCVFGRNIGLLDYRSWPDDRCQSIFALKPSWHAEIWNQSSGQVVKPNSPTLQPKTHLRKNAPRIVEMIAQTDQAVVGFRDPPPLTETEMLTQTERIIVHAAWPS
jgi:hypothetical protein